MKYRVVSLPAVQNDIREAMGYYQKINTKMKSNLLAEYAKPISFWNLCHSDSNKNTKRFAPYF
jgi:hypothetical protein